MSLLFFRVDLARLIDFLGKRAQLDGGFASFPTLPATIADTFYALDLLVCLRDLFPDAGLDSLIFRTLTRQYLARSIQHSERLPLRLRFFLFRLTSLFGLDPSPLARPGEERAPLSAEDRYYGAQLGLHLPPLRLTRPYGGCRQVMFVLLSGRSVEAVEARRLGDWLRQCQNGDGGFGFYPHTTSYIENSYFSLQALALLRQTPAAPAAASQFICSCQTSCGGFSRNIRAAPFLDASWYGIQALQALEQIYHSD